MTREQIHAKVNKEGSISKANTIDFMWEHFQSRTCENCKHRKEMIYCNVLWTDVGEVEHLWVSKDFGCNKFERKDK